MRRVILILWLLFSGIIVQAQEWESIGHGVNFSKKTTGKNIAICFAGWTVRQSWSNSWAEELHKARLQEMNVGYLFAVKGPRDVAFESLEIRTKKLANHILTLFRNLKQNEFVPEITVIAHSSGAYVAHNFFTHLFTQVAEEEGLSDRVSYYCLDGAIGTSVFGTTLTEKIAGYLKRIVAVYAYDPGLNIQSPNRDAMSSMAEKFPDKAILRIVQTSNSGCSGRWCLHETLIIKRPYYAKRFNLEKDYGSINDLRPVCWEYLKEE